MRPHYHPLGSSKWGQIYFLTKNKCVPIITHSLELFVRVVHQNEGKLSNNKKQSHFSWMTEVEIGEAEAVVCQAFSGTD